MGQQPDVPKVRNVCSLKEPIFVLQVSPGVWEMAAELPEDFVTGYGFAIATGSAAIMSLYQVRR